MVVYSAYIKMYFVKILVFLMYVGEKVFVYSQLQWMNLREYIISIYFENIIKYDVNEMGENLLMEMKVCCYDFRYFLKIIKWSMESNQTILSIMVCECWCL